MTSVARHSLTYAVLLPNQPIRQVYFQMFDGRNTILCRDLSKTAEEDDGNVDKTIRLITQDKKRTWWRVITQDKKRTGIRVITQDKKRTWIAEIKLAFAPSCSRMRRQLLRFQAVCKTWSVFQELTSIFSFRKRRWRQLKFSENRNKQCNQSKYLLRKTQGLCRNMFLLLLDGAVVVFVCSVKGPSRPLPCFS